MAEKIRFEATRATRDGSDDTEVTGRNYDQAIIWRNGILYAPPQPRFGYELNPGTDQIVLDEATEEGEAVIAMTIYDDDQKKVAGDGQGGGK